jgi:hypothetical protein
MSRFCFALLALALSGCSSPETVSPLPPLAPVPPPPLEGVCSPSVFIDEQCFDTEQCVVLNDTPCDAGTCLDGSCVQ